MDDEFREELARIALGELPPGVGFAVIDDPASHGWQRRSDLDADGAQIWERPDGRLVAVAGAGEGFSARMASRPLDR